MKGTRIVARRPSSGDDAEDKITTDEGASIPQPTSVAVIVEPETKAEPDHKRRRITRREELPFTQEERLAVEQEIISANKSKRSIEEKKKAHDKVWNGEIAQHEATMNEAVDVLEKGSFTVEIERIEEFNYDLKMKIYYDVSSGEEVDSVDMTDEDLQTKMDM